jgi:hypothetical protein
MRLEIKFEQSLVLEPFQSAEVWLYAIFNNISVILWLSVFLVEETEVPGEKQWSAASHWQTLSHTVVSSTPCQERDSNSQL